MKRSFVAALGIAIAVLVTATVAIAAPSLFSPSKTVGDLSTATTNVEGVSLNVDTSTPEYTEALQAAKNVVEQMQSFLAGGTIEDYFASLPDGQAVIDAIKSVVGDAAFDVNEVAPFVVQGWTEDKGPVEFTMEFPTQYEEGAKVAVLIGVLDADGNVTWTVIEGVAQADGSIKFELDVKTLKDVAENTSIIAIASTPDAVSEAAPAAK